MISMSLELRPYQKNALDAWIDNNYRGSIILPTGAGKTEVAIGAVRAVQARDKFNTKVLFLVPRINLISQTITRFEKNGVNASAFYGTEKDLSGIVVVATYQSAYDRLDMLARFNMVIFDEVHLVSETATMYNQLIHFCGEDTSKAVLCLTATINEEDEKNQSILRHAPIVYHMSVGEAIKDGYLAKVHVFDESVHLEQENQYIYDQATRKINNISQQLKTYDAIAMTKYLASGNPYYKQLAGAWFTAVRERTRVLNTDSEKILRVGELMNKLTGKTLVYAERTQTLFVLKKLFPSSFDFITAQVPPSTRQLILTRWGKDFNFLGTVHTLDIGSDFPDCMNAIVVASNKNPNQIIQRIGRVVRPHPDKPHAGIYVVYAKDTKEFRVYQTIVNAVSTF